MEVEQTSFVPGLQRSALPRFHGRDAPARCTSPPWRCWTAGPAAWSRTPAAPAGNSPVSGPGWKLPFVVAQGVAGNPGFISPRQDGILLPFQPGVQRDDPLRLRQGLGERAGGQEPGPAGGAAGPRRLLPGQYSSRGSQRGQERPRRPPGRDRRRRGPRGVPWPAAEPAPRPSGNGSTSGQSGLRE